MSGDAGSHDPGDPADAAGVADAADLAGGTLTWRRLLVETNRRLGDWTEARWLCQEASGLEGADWVLGLEDRATERAVSRLDAMVARRLQGEPLQYVLGHWSFRTLDLLVDRRVLIPRPETEHLVEVALSIARATTGPLTIADLGTGSGAIAMALAAELFPRPLTVWATDASDDVLAVARANLAGMGRAAVAVRMEAGSWYDALPPDLAGRLDLVVSNPPYIGTDRGPRRARPRLGAGGRAAGRPGWPGRAARGDRRRARAGWPREGRWSARSAPHKAPRSSPSPTPPG